MINFSCVWQSAMEGNFNGNQKPECIEIQHTINRCLEVPFQVHWWCLRWVGIVELTNFYFVSHLLSALIMNPRDSVLKRQLEVVSYFKTLYSLLWFNDFDLDFSVLVLGIHMISHNFYWKLFYYLLMTKHNPMRMYRCVLAQAIQ